MKVLLKSLLEVWRRLGILAALTGLACTLSAQAGTILYSNDVQGEVLPCGCRTSPYGGIGRKAGLAAKLRKAGEKTILQVDGGNLLFDSEIIPEALIPRSRLQAKDLLLAQSRIGRLLITPGPRDLSLGLETLKALTPAKEVSWLSLNLRNRNTPVFPSHERIPFEKFHLRVIGYSSPLLKYGSEIQATEEITTLASLVQEAKKQGDRILVLSHQGIEADEALARKIPEIDWIVGAHSQSFLMTPLKVGQTQIFQSSFKNQYVGVIRLDDHGNLLSHELVPLDESLDAFTPPWAKKLERTWKQKGSRLQ